MRSHFLPSRTLGVLFLLLLNNLMLRATTGAEPSASADVPSGIAAVGSEQAGDMYCGPRCVQAVLRYYGRREELRPLVDEIQDSDWRRGSTLAAIQSALERRDIHTAALRISNETRIDWPNPVIMHLRPLRSDGIGHFVVILPQDASDSAAVWCGLSGVQRVKPHVLMDASSGVILLTASTPIQTPLLAVRRSAERCQPSVATRIGLAGAAAVVVCCLLRRTAKSFLLHSNPGESHEK